MAPVHEQNTEAWDRVHSVNIRSVFFCMKYGVTAMLRWGLATEIASAALFLASDEDSYSTGVTLPVDGGYCMGFSGMGAENDGRPKV
jgi:NAD(P)-dependent dehydrogenase (short-subunit alcohol dehydrogenase family)